MTCPFCGEELLMGCRVDNEHTYYCKNSHSFVFTHEEEDEPYIMDNFCKLIQ